MSRSMWIVVLSAIACASCATLGSSAPMREYQVDEPIPLGRDGSAEVSLKAGPFEVVKVLVRNQPNPAEVRERGWCRPKPTIVARSTAKDGDVAMVSLVSILEDDQGAPLMTCSSRKPQELFGGMTDDWNTCFLEAMRAEDWPKVKYFHAIVTFRAREEPAQPEQ